MGLPAPSLDGRLPAQKTARSEAQRRGQGDCLESAIPTAQTLPQTYRSRKEQKSNRRGGGARVAGLHLGYRRKNRTKLSASGGVTARLKVELLITGKPGRW